MSRSTLEVLAYFLEAKRKPVHGLELIKATRYKSGTIYPILERLETAGWLEAQWEDVDAAREKRPRRRNYRLTGEGARAAHYELVRAAEPLMKALRPNLGAGEW
jgi:PadR family transcriptional regulator, regulatory protein PadR